MMNQPLYTINHKEPTNNLSPSEIATRLSEVVEGLNTCDAAIFVRANPESTKEWQDAFRLFRGYYSHLSEQVIATTELIAGSLLFTAGGDKFKTLFEEHIELLGEEVLDTIEQASMGFMDSFLEPSCNTKPIYSLIEGGFKTYAKVGDYFDYLPYCTGGSNGIKPHEIHSVCPVCSKGALEINRFTNWASCSLGCNVTPSLLQMARKNGFIEQHILDFNKNANKLTPRGNVTEASGEFIEVTEEDIKLGVTMVSAPMKSGKTRGFVQKAINATDGHVLVLVPRNTLAYDAANRLGGQHLKDINKDLPPKVITCCLESIENVKSIPFSTVVVDEFSQAVSQAASGDTCKTIQPIITLLQMISMVRKKGRVLLLEDGISNLEAELLEACNVPIDNTFVFTKEYPVKREAVFLPEGKAFNLAIQESVKAGEKVMVFSDGGKHNIGEAFLQAVEYSLVNDLGLDKSEVLLISGKSNNCKRAKAVINDPDYACQRMGIKVLLASPTLQMGISFNDPDNYFDKVFCHFVHIEPRIAIQMSERLRTDVPRFFHIKNTFSVPDSNTHVLDWKELKRIDLESNASTLKATGLDQSQPGSLDGNRLALSLSVSDYGYKIKARANYANKARVEAFQKLYSDRGYTIVDPSNEPIDNEELFSIAKELSKAEALSTFTNGDLRLTKEQAYLVIRADQNKKVDPETKQVVLDFVAEHGPGSTYLVAKRVQLENEFAGLNWLDKEIADFYYFQGGLSKVKFTLITNNLDRYKQIVGQELITYKGNNPLNWLPSTNRYNFPRMEFYADQMFILKRLLKQGHIRKADPLLAKLKESVLSSGYSKYAPNAKRDSSLAVAKGLLKALGLGLEKDGRKPSYKIVYPKAYKLAKDISKAKLESRLKATKE